MPILVARNDIAGPRDPWLHSDESGKSFAGRRRSKGVKKESNVGSVVPNEQLEKFIGAVLESETPSQKVLKF